MLEKIQKWLANPKRDYHEGKQYFEKYASIAAKQQFLNYFNEIKPGESVDQFDSHFTILVNQVSFVQVRLKNNPKAFAAAIGGAAGRKAAQLVNINSGKGAGTGQPPTPPGTPLKLENLPKQFDKERERLKELVPLMASLHADLGNAGADEERAALADKIVALDLERRSIWDKIDNYLDEEGKALDPLEVENEYSENDFVRGAQLAARVKRLKDNIRKNEAALLKHKENGKDHLIPRTENRIARQNQELAEAEAELAKTEKPGDE